MHNILIFAGTTEGRQLLEDLSRCPVQLVACVATQYGENLLPRGERVRVETGRMDAQQMAQLMRQTAFSCVIDATHPYATEATDQIRQACDQTGTRYLRLLRQPGGEGIAGCAYVADTAQAVQYLQGTEGRVLLTTGSKELEAFTALPGYRERLFCRVLPVADVLQKCAALGIEGGHLIAMQGPFSEELNLALLRQVGARYLVTKESGAAGRFEEKIRAAQKAGATAVVIGRPRQEEGLSYAQVLELLRREWGISPPPAPAGLFFPLFVPLQGRRVLVVGAGAIATRRIQALLPFGCRVEVVAPAASPRVEELAAGGQLQFWRRGYQPGDCAGAALAVAATDRRDTNHAVFEECSRLQIPVSVADKKEECSFYFPAVVEKEGLVIGVTASGRDHRLARVAAQNIRAQIGQLAQEGDQP